MCAKPVVLALSGHDPSGAAGVQADIEALAHTGCHCISVITSLTAQNTAEFRSMTPQEPARFREQLDLLTGDITVDACKIGLIGSSQLVEVIADYLRDANCPVVLDPILGSGTGVSLALPGLVPKLVDHLFPHATVITPNLEEAQALTGCNDAIKALHALLDLGCDTALITGADNGRGEVLNTWMDNTRAVHSYSWKKLHGCTPLPVSLTSSLAKPRPKFHPPARAHHKWAWPAMGVVWS